MPIKKVKQPEKVETKKPEKKTGANLKANLAKKLEKKNIELPSKEGIDIDIDTPAEVENKVKPVLPLPKYSIGLVGNDPIINKFGGMVKMSGSKIQYVLHSLMTKWLEDNKS